MRRNREAERGQVLIWVAASLVLVGLTLVLVSVALAGRKARLERTRDQMSAELARLENEKLAVFNRAREVLPVSGFMEPPITEPVDAADAPDPATLITMLGTHEASLRAAIAEARTAVTQKITEIPSLPFGAPPEAPANLAALRTTLEQSATVLDDDARTKNTPLPHGSLDTFLALEPYLWSYAQVYSVWQAFAVAEKQATAAAQIPPDLGATLGQVFTAQRDEIQRRITETRNQRNIEHAAHQDRVRRIQEEKRRGTDEALRTTNPMQAQEIPNLGKEILSLQGELARMRVLEVRRFEVLETHGRLLEPEADLRRASIDRGARDRVVPGLRFLVGRRGPRGRLEAKGRVEVRRVEETVAHVQILEVADAWNPLVEGDLLWNPFYHPRRAVVVALIGDESIPGASFGKTGLTADLRGLGVDVRTAIDPDVDFIVGTSGFQSKPEYQLALQLELPVAEPSQYLPFLE